MPATISHFAGTRSGPSTRTVKEPGPAAANRRPARMTEPTAKREGNTGGVDQETMLHHLEELAKRLGVEVRYEAAAGRVGKGVLRGRKIAVIDASLRVHERVAALASILADEPTNGVYLPPAVRTRLEAGRAADPSSGDNGNGADPEADAV